MVSVSKRIRTISYWEAQARWQKTWLEHGDYHREIIALVTQRTLPDWKVLDIGAGSGVLALPLKELGCEVTALEPSQGMRNLLREASSGYLRPNLTVDVRPWEELPLSEAQGFHLILACNSLHLTPLGFSEALAKIFLAQPQHVCVISEVPFLEADLKPRYDDYHLQGERLLQVDSSFAYHSLDEVWEHFLHRRGRRPSLRERAHIRNQLIFAHEHYWLKQEAQVAILWWSKKDVVGEEKYGKKDFWGDGDYRAAGNFLAEAGHGEGTRENSPVVSTGGN
jgi:SAM-dependent methyltransferase